MSSCPTIRCGTLKPRETEHPASRYLQITGVVIAILSAAAAVGIGWGMPSISLPLLGAAGSICAVSVLTALFLKIVKQTPPPLATRAQPPAADPPQAAEHQPAESGKDEVADCNLCTGAYFHTTTLANLRSILSDQYIEPREAKMGKGAYVSTSFGTVTRGQPNTDYTIAFNRSIENGSCHCFRPHHGPSPRQLMHRNTIWIGFLENVPVTKDSVAYIVVPDGNTEELLYPTVKESEVKGHFNTLGDQHRCRVQDVPELRGWDVRNRVISCYGDEVDYS